MKIKGLSPEVQAHISNIRLEDLRECIADLPNTICKNLTVDAGCSDRVLEGKKEIELGAKTAVGEIMEYLNMFLEGTFNKEHALATHNELNILKEKGLL